MTRKIKCQNTECTAMILPATAEKTDGVCMPCQRKAKQIAKEKYIRENRKDIDPYQGISDLVELLKINFEISQKNYDPLINYLPCKYSSEELYGMMSQQQVTQLIDEVVQNNAYYGDQIIGEIALFTEADMTNALIFYMELEAYSPSYMFRAASSQITQNLISNVSTNPDKILQALSSIRTDQVLAQFSQWREHPPKWTAELFIPPEEYARCNGWELDDNAQARELTLGTCYPLIAKTSVQQTSIVTTCTKSDDTCHWCNSPMSNLFEFDLRESQLSFIPFSQEKLIITTCELCASYGDHLFMKIDKDGKPSWHENNQRPDYLPDIDDYAPLPANTLTLSHKAGSVYRSADPFSPTIMTSQVGGLPGWVQDFSYTPCPDCQKSMIFIAQLAVEDIIDYGEGIYYALLCPDCSVSTVTYQQT